MKSPLAIAQACAAIFAFGLDRWSKAWIVAHMQNGIVRPFLEGLVQLNLTQNTGAAFSLGRDNGQLMTAVATAVTVFLIGWAIWRHRKYPGQMALEKIGTGLLMGGALGNLFDRYAHGQVTDFLQFTFVDFPIFNCADALIDIGIGLIFIDVLANSRAAGGQSNS